MGWEAKCDCWDIPDPRCLECGTRESRKAGPKVAKVSGWVSGYLLAQGLVHTAIPRKPGQVEFLLEGYCDTKETITVTQVARWGGVVAIGDPKMRPYIIERKEDAIGILSDIIMRFDT